jgi:hypothetical protein
MVTITFTVPVTSAGDTTVIDVDDTTVTLVPATVPKSTVAPELKPEPVMVTVVPPTVDPTVGVMDVTVRGA